MNTRQLQRSFVLLILMCVTFLGIVACSPKHLPIQTASFARSPNFTVYDALIYSDKPEIGMTPILVTGRGYSKQEGGEPDEESCRQLAREAAQKYSKFVINIERWNLDTRRASKAEVQTNVEKILQVIRWMKSERPKLQIGFYGAPPHRDYWTPVRNNVGGIVDWQKANDDLKPIADAVDFIAPSLYTFYDDVDGWVKYAKANIAEAQRFGKPVLPFLWARYHVSNRQSKLKFLPGDYWKTQLQTVRESGAQGVILWDWFGFTGSSARSLDTNQDWWKETMKFIANKS